MAVLTVPLMRYTFVLICITLSFESILTKEYVPVYMWGSLSGSKISEPISALNRISSTEFKDILMKRLRHKPVVVFVEENLSIEDFSWQDALGQGSFPKLASLMDSVESVTYFPSVYAPAHALRDWSRDWTHASLYPDGLEPDLTLLNETMIFINLVDASENEDRPHLLKRHDSFMSDIYENLLMKYEDLVAIYTAQHSSWSDEDLSSRRIRTKREDKDEEDQTQLYNGNNTIYLYTTTFPKLKIKGQDFQLNKTLSETADEGDGDRDSILTVVYDTNPEVRVEFFFHETAPNYWSLNVINVTNSSDSYILTAKGIEAPFGFSYHCSQSVQFEDPTSTENEETSLTFGNIQVQPDLEKITDDAVPKFGDAYDCVYFMTVPILSGFFVTVIFALIMGFGICMIMDIKTMDRFDDPKGKTISISATE